jgi:tRNA A64-2'-O-ribosylphosphate transferase
MPDALSKTVPIWCAVINRCVGEGKQWTETHLPSVCVSPQEASSIEALIPMFVRSLKVNFYPTQLIIGLRTRHIIHLTDIG